MLSGVSVAAVYFGLPDEFPRVSIQAQHRLRLLPRIRRGEIDSITDNGRRPVPAAGHGRFPQNAFGFTPLNGRVLSGCSNAIARRSTPRRPVGRGEGER